MGRTPTFRGFGGEGGPSIGEAARPGRGNDVAFRSDRDRVGLRGADGRPLRGRANLAPIVIEGKEPGGQLTWTSEVENFPGFPEGILGPELMERMKKQAQRFGADCREFEKVIEVDLSQRPFRVKTNRSWSTRGTVDYTADSLIIASGATAKTLGLPDEMVYMKAGLSTCATCDGASIKGKKIAVVGGGDTAVEEATFLTRFAREVTLIHRRDSLRASPIMQDRLFANKKIDYAWNFAPVEYLGEKEPYLKLNGVRLQIDQGRLDPRPDGQRPVPGDRPHAQHGGLQGATRDDPRRLPPESDGPGLEGDRGARRPVRIDAQLRNGHERRGGLRRRRRGGYPLPTGRSPPPAPAAPRRSIAKNGSKDCIIRPDFESLVGTWRTSRVKADVRIRGSARFSPGPLHPRHADFSAEFAYNTYWPGNSPRHRDAEIVPAVEVGFLGN